MIDVNLLKGFHQSERKSSFPTNLFSFSARNFDFEAQLELPCSAPQHSARMWQTAKAYLKEQTVKWLRCVARRVLIGGWGGVKYWGVFFRLVSRGALEDLLSGLGSEAMGDCLLRDEVMNRKLGLLEKEPSAPTSVDEDDPLRSTSSEELDSARRMGSGGLGWAGDCRSHLGRSLGGECRKNQGDNGGGRRSGNRPAGCDRSDGGSGPGPFDGDWMEGREQSVFSMGEWDCSEGEDDLNRRERWKRVEDEVGLRTGWLGSAVDERVYGGAPGSANGNAPVCGMEEREAVRTIEEWGVYLRLKKLAAQVDRPFRICVKGLAGNVRQVVRLSAFVAGFETVNETKEKNMWLGQRSEADESTPVKPSDVALGKKSGRELSSQPTLEEFSHLRTITEGQIADMDIQIQQAIVAYLSTWMTDVSETFKRSETCCTSLELNCFLMHPEWVLQQAADLAGQCCLVAVPVSNGHLKIQKLARSMRCTSTNQANAQEIGESQFKQLRQKCQGLDSASISPKSLVVERLQECYRSRQREHIFILEVPNNDVRQILMNLAKAIGFTAPKVTTKGKFVACKGKPGPSTDGNKSIYCVSQADMRHVEESVQQGVRSFILSWFAYFEKANISQKLLTTSSFLMPDNWVEGVVKSIAEPISAEVKTKSPGTLEITRKEVTKHSNNTKQVWMLENLTGCFTTDTNGSQIESDSKDSESTSLSVLPSQTQNQRLEKVPKVCDEALQTFHSDQVGVWNQLKYLYKQKRQGAHLVWAEGLQKHVKETICHAGLKLGFTSTQDLGPYIRLSRFDCLVPGEPSGYRGQGCNGCKLGKLADTLRKKVISLDAEVIPTIEAHIDSLLHDLMLGDDFGIRVELEKYPLPEFWVVRIVDKCMKRINQSSGQLYASNSSVVMKHHENGVAHLEKMKETTSKTIGNSNFTDLSMSTSMVRQSLNPAPNGIAGPGRVEGVLEQTPKCDLFTSSLGHSRGAGLMYQPGFSDKGFSAARQASKQTSSSLQHRMDIILPSSCTYCLPANGIEAGRQQRSFCCVENKDQEHRALPLKSPQDHDLIVPTTHSGSYGMGTDISLVASPPALSSLEVLENFRASFHPTGLLDSPRVSSILPPDIGKFSARGPHPWNKKDGYGHVDPFRQNLELESHSASLSVLPLKAKVHYVKTLEDMAFWCNFIIASKVKVMGIDTEWKPNLSPGDNHPVALIQICFRVFTAYKSRAPTYLCILFHVHHSSFTASFVALLENYSIMKVGVQIDMDVHKVRRDHLIEMNNCVELYTEAGDKGIYARGLKGLVAAVLHHDLPKNKSVTLSNWEETPLTQQQEQYAAYDAYAALRVFEELHGIGGSIHV